MTHIAPSIAGPAANALSSLTESQVSFIRSLPKAELHCHLNGSIPLATLQRLAAERDDLTDEASEAVKSGLETLKQGVQLSAIGDFFGLFPAVYSLTSNPAALREVTRDVLHVFLDPKSEGDQIIPPECAYLELRSTPRKTPHMTRKQYIEAVLAEVEAYPADKAALIVSVDRRMSVEDALECVSLAVNLRNEGRRVVGVDLCGDPKAGDMKNFIPAFEMVHKAGLGLTLHIAELPPDTDVLLSAHPTRLGHATFLNDAEQKYICDNKIPIEICLTSNLLCKTVTDLESHHINAYLQQDHPVSICTDDILPFRTSLAAEYALLLAKAPLGLGLTEEQVEKIARFGMASRFTSP
ncbi:hypothetical protein M407DRAFT_74594 [Tulasnella calospora MUT 4182]|uniref:Adenosine deaminase domain-containing protein n=1 Tax=Tulasnella calospora MUT 4182 TaxID=1051891 RepID=A0A0C3KY32_9AGAM|nr:hypothetical protein M407DRAFT_74594 [Tulasnella calospora MUT 4182]